MEKQKIKITHDKSLAISTAPNRKATTWKNQVFLWSVFLGKLQETTRTQETFFDFSKMSREEKGDVKDVGGFVGGVLKDNKRKADKVKSRSMLTLDIDYGDEAVYNLIEMSIDYAYAIYSTHSHSESKPRLRFIVPLKREVSAEEYEPIARKVASEIGMDYFDDTSYQAHRLMYWPSTSKDAEYIFNYYDAEFLDPDKILDKYLDWKDHLEWPVSSRDNQKKNIDNLAKKQGDPLTKAGQVGYFCQTYDIYSAIETYLPEVYEKYSDDRYTYTDGSTVGGLVVYQEGLFAYSHHGTDPCSGLLCNAFDLVRLHKFGKLDDNSKRDTPVNRLPSFLAMSELASEDVNVKAIMTTSRFKDAIADFEDIWLDTVEIDSKDELNKEDLNRLPSAEEVLEDRKSWIGKLKANKSGNFEVTIPNIVTILENDMLLKNRIAFNDFNKRLMLKHSTLWNRITKEVPWGDSDDSSLRNYLEKVYGIYSVGKTNDAVASVSMKNKYNPVKDYLNGLVWDGVPRLERLFIKYLGAEDTEVNKAVTRKAFAAAVGRIVAPGIKFDYMVTLTGKQGLGKSMIFDVMGGEYFSDSLTSVSGKEAYESLQGVWLMEMAELTATKKAEVEAIKQFISKRSDKFRPAYGRHLQDYPRQCVFFGTTNDDFFIKDKTGGRRFWPIKVSKERIEEHWSKITPEIRDQIWAEAKHFWERGEKLYLTEDLEKEMFEIQTQHTDTSPFYGVVVEYLNRKLPIDWDSKNLKDRLEWLKTDDDDIFGENPGTIERTKVCALEIWCECLGKQRERFDFNARNEIRGILDSLEDWEHYTGNEKGLLRFGKDYGTQKAYTKKT